MNKHLARNEVAPGKGDTVKRVGAEGWVGRGLGMGGRRRK